MSFYGLLLIENILEALIFTQKCLSIGSGFFGGSSFHYEYASENLGIHFWFCVECKCTNSCII